MDEPSILRERLDVASNWRGVELADDASWRYTLSPDEVAALEAGLAHARASGKAREALTRDDFPLGALAPAVEQWMHTLQHGRGFLNVRGLPVERWSQEESEWAYWGLGIHMGTPVSQNAAGDLLGHVRDTGADPTDPAVRLYKTTVELGFHSDGSDLVGLMCLRQGRSGGETRLVSTAAIYEELLRRRPDLVPLLYERFAWDRNEEQAEGEPGFFELPICRFAGGKLSFFYIPWYIRRAQRHADAPRLSAQQHELLDLIDAVAADPALHLSMRLEPGEINFLKNNTALHARTDYVDHAETERKRHLLRL